MKLFKTTAFVIGLFLLLICCFYFWAGSPTLKKDNYYSIKQYESSTKKPSDTLKIMTYNLGYLSGMTNNLAMDRSASLLAGNLLKSQALLESHKADVVAFQEIDFDAQRSKHVNQLDSLAIDAEYAFSAKAVNWDKSYVPFPYWPVKYHFGKTVSGQAIISKMQILTQEVTVLEKPLSAPFYYNKFYLDRLMQVAFMKVNDVDTLVVINIHLEAFDQATREAQAKVVIAKFEELASQFPVILLGDFNASPPLPIREEQQESTLVKLFTSSGIMEAIDPKEYLANKERFYTFDTSAPYERLDYIFYNNNRIKKVAAGVAREAGDISDHSPVWMTFTLTK